jgi:hypothetical protein
MLKALPEIFPPVDILRIDTANLECFRDALYLVDPNLVHIDVASPNFV